MFDCLGRIVKEEGYRYIWRGNLTNILRYIPKTAVKIAQIDQIKRLFEDKNPDSSFMKRAIFSFGSASTIMLISMSLLYPFDLVRVKITADTRHVYKGIVDCTKSVLKKNGIIGLYYGFWISYFAVLFHRATFYGLYYAVNIKTDTSSSLYAKYLIGISTSGMAHLLTYPFDTINRRMMM